MQVTRHTSTSQRNALRGTGLAWPFAATLAASPATGTNRKPQHRRT